MKVSIKDLSAGLLAAVTLVPAVLTSNATWVDPGIHLAYQDGQVVIASVDYGSAAQQDNLYVGEVVAGLNGALVLDQSDDVKRRLAASPDRVVTLQLIGPSEVASAMQAVADGRFDENGYIWADPVMKEVPGPGPGTWTSVVDYHMALGYSYARWNGTADVPPLTLGLLILFIGWWLIGRGRLGRTLRPYAVTLPVATAMPLLVGPVDRYPLFAATAIESVLLSAAMLPLGLDFVATFAARRARVLGGLGVLALAAVAALVGLLVPIRWTVGWSLQGMPLIHVLLVAAVAFIPGILAAQPAVDWRARNVGSGEPGRMVDSTELAVAALTPAVACLSLVPGWGYTLWPILLWLGGIFAVRRFTLTPLLRVVSRTRYQRDLVVRATESERARIAADIHDYALQDLTMLIRRLDTAGDAENAAAAREVTDRLRVICGELRLPVLDDLGVGPALEWLIQRHEANGHKIDLDRLAEEKRLPADVELAFFRVAQEAIANAVRHGSPPIRVRYRGEGSSAELEVDDAGPGIPTDAAEKAERLGHLGLMNMSQRAEALGADLSIGRRPGGGTRVQLVWVSNEGVATAPVREAPSAEPA
jgi:signal transduction histidine kinase